MTSVPAASAEPLVGAYVDGPPLCPRQVVRWWGQFVAAHELDDTFDPDREQYLTVYAYPHNDFVRHMNLSGGSPRGYAGPAACPFLVFDIDRCGDLDSALADTNTLVRYMTQRYGPAVEDGIGVYFSGGKGYHVALALPAAPTAETVPAAIRAFALRIAAEAKIQIDQTCYDHQRILRLPNSRHPRTGLFKRMIRPEELYTLSTNQILDLAPRHPAGYAVPALSVPVPSLDVDWSVSIASASAGSRRSTGGSADVSHPVVPKFVRDFIGFNDVQDPGRAVTLFRCAAALSQAFEKGGPDAVIRGLLEEVALKTGLEPREVEKQIRDGIARGRRDAATGGPPA